MKINQVNINVNTDACLDLEYINEVIVNISSRIILADGQVSLSFINDVDMLKLNSDYRSINKTTDVLTFCIDDEDILGDIYISPDTVQKNAIENNIEFKEELSRVIAHAFAHLVGYDHETDEEYHIMHDYEDFLLTRYETI
ncbi:MAG: rRNA maturation RNase YbeY [Candidatus Margulisbacteria bacterium GWF2_35_9]|nr:MAG: rRNA maturation RNase YbeY [Candidatus Margulisbacteria bacterium GWF2_35_9]